MPIDLPDDYWIDVPGGTYTVGFTPEDARVYGEQAAAYRNAQGAPEGQGLRALEEHETKWGNPEYHAAQALKTRPARTVEIPAFSIARYPVTGELFLRFVRETGHAASDELLAWASAHPDWPVRYVSWREVEAFMAWAGYRIPFDDEWERAARGEERRIFPWGNDFGERGGELLQLARGNKLAPDLARRYATPEGFVAFADKDWEWCANLFPEPGGWQIEDAWMREQSRWSRRIKGLAGAYEAPNVASYSFAMETGSEGFRLVKHNGRAIPVAPPMTGWSAAGPRAVEFEQSVVRPALEAARPELELHKSHVWDEHQRAPEPFGVAPAYLADSFKASFGKRPGKLRFAYGVAPSEPTHGAYLGAVTLESFRRAANPNHGLFLWTMLYRLDQEENIVAHPVSLFRMHWDGQWHRFDDRFRPGEDLTPIAEITPAMVTAQVLDAFRFYEAYADADQPPPFDPARRETRVPPAPVFRIPKAGPSR